MNIQGRLNRVTDIKAFLTSFSSTGGKPTKGFVPWAKARIQLATDFPTGDFGGGFIPDMSFKADTNSAGRFKIAVPEALAKSRGRVLAFDVHNIANPVPSLPPLPVLDVVYRSAAFKFADVSAAEQAQVQDIFVFLAKTPTESGISQEALDAQLGDLKKSLKLDKIRATIGAKSVSVKADKSGGELTFKAHVRGSTSHDLDRVIEIKASEMDVDLPGPDFIVGLCIDEDEIEANARKGLVKMSAQVSKTLLGELDKQFPGITSQATVSVWRSRHVQTGTKSINVPGFPAIQVPVFAVVPDGALGVPRQLY